MRVRKKIAALTLALITLMPVVAQAHEAYYIQTLIDDTTLLYKSFVIKDESNSDGGHQEVKFGNFTTISDYKAAKNWFAGGKSVNESNYETLKKDGTAEYLTFSFPPRSVKGSDNKNINATGKHIEKAFEIKSILIPQLNEALTLINNGQNYTTIENLIEASESLMGGKVSGWDINYSTSPAEDGSLTVTLKNNNVTPSKTYTFQYGIEKGYADSNSPLYNAAYSSDGPKDYLTWHQLVAHANYAFNHSNESYVVSNFAYADSTGVIAGFFADVFGGMLDGMRDILELFSIEELVYNQGIRGISNVYYNGALTLDALESTEIFYLVSACIALSMLCTAMVWLLLKKSWSTMNTTVRVGLMEGIQNILITAFLLGLSYPFASLLMELNCKFVGIFGAMQGDRQLFTSAQSYNGAIGAIIIQFFYFFICVYVNFVYIMRGLWIIILLGTAPLWIVGLAFGNKGKGYADLWLKHLIMNIFLQSFHALFLTLFDTALLGARGIEGFVLCFTLIPLTSFFKNLILGNDGDIGGKAFEGVTSIGAGAAVGAITAKAMSKKKDNSNSKDSDKQGDGNDDSTTPKTKDPNGNGPNGSGPEGGERKKSTGTDGSISANAEAPKLQESSIKEKNESLKDEYGSTSSEKNDTDKYASLKKIGGALGKGATNATITAAKNVPGVVAAGGAMAIGSAMTMASGGKVGGDIIRKSSQRIGSAAKDVGGEAMSGGKEALGYIGNDIKKGAKKVGNQLENFAKDTLADNKLKSIEKNQEDGNSSLDTGAMYTKTLKGGLMEDNFRNEDLLSSQGIVIGEGTGNPKEDFSIVADLSKDTDMSETYKSIRDIQSSKNIEEMSSAVGGMAQKYASYENETYGAENNCEAFSASKATEVTNAWNEYKGNNNWSQKMEEVHFDNFKKDYLGQMGISKVNVNKQNPNEVGISYNQLGKEYLGIEKSRVSDKGVVKVTRQSTPNSDKDKNRTYGYNFNSLNQQYQGYQGMPSASKTNDKIG